MSKTLGQERQACKGSKQVETVAGMVTLSVGGVSTGERDGVLLLQFVPEDPDNGAVMCRHGAPKVEMPVEAFCDGGMAYRADGNVCIMWKVL